VEIEVSDAEIPAATELLQVIRCVGGPHKALRGTAISSLSHFSPFSLHRLLTEHVKGSHLVVNGVATNQAPAGAAYGGAAPPTAFAAAPAAAAAPPPTGPAPPLKDQIRAVLLRVDAEGSNADQVRCGAMHERGGSRPSLTASRRGRVRAAALK